MSQALDQADAALADVQHRAERFADRARATAYPASDAVEAALRRQS